MSVEGNIVLAVGVPGADSNQGAVGLFAGSSLDNLTSSWVITPNLLNDGDFFGMKVVLAGGLLAVSATGRSARKGSVFVFDAESSKNLVAEYTHTLPSSGDLFSSGLDLTGDGNMIVGVGGDESGEGSGILFNIVS